MIVIKPKYVLPENAQSVVITRILSPSDPLGIKEYISNAGFSNIFQA